jgi:hypothetical protein
MAQRLRCVPLSNVWHSTTACSRWPLIDYWSRAHLPASAALCDECSSLDDATTSRSPGAVDVATAPAGTG